MANPLFEGATLSPAKVETEQEKLNRKKLSLELYRRESDPLRAPTLLDESELKLDPEYKKQVDVINKEKFGINPEHGKWSKDGDQWKVEPQSSVFDQFAGGFVRPFEKAAKGSEEPSSLNAYKVADEGKTTLQKAANVVGQAAGYAAEYAPVMKSVGALGLGTNLFKTLAEKQAVKTVAGELGKETLKKRLRSYTAKRVIGQMVDEGIAGAVVAGVESRGDPKTTGMGFGLGATAPVFGEYVAKPVFNAIKPYAGKFASYLYNKVKTGTKNMTEQEVRQAMSNPQVVQNTVAEAAGETVDNVAKEAQKVSGQTVIPAQKQRGFVETIKESPRTDPIVKAGVKGTYTPITNKDTLEVARKAIIDNEDNVLTEVLGPAEASADQVAKAQLLIDKYSNEGKHEQAIQVVENIAKKLTAQGQSIQAASMWNRLTPSGILKTAQRTFDKANQLNPKAGLKLTKDMTQELTELAQKIQEMPDGEEKTRATLMMLKKISDKIPTSLGKKIDTIQTIGQLLNPKTMTRNVLGNAMFGAVENTQQALAAGIDKGVSMVTGKRSVLMPNPKEQIKGGWYGIKQGYKDAIQGIDTGGVGTQFDLPAGNIFKNKVGKAAETALSIGLKTPDRGFYEAYKGEYLAMAKKLAKINGEKFDLDTALKEADLVAKYRTFQDDTAWSKAFTGIKNSLNAGKDFGLGSFVLKYPKTPANLLARSIDYSPVSFVRAVNVLGKKWFKGEVFNQKQFVTDLSKGLTGTGLIGMGYYLTDLGLVTGAPNKDRDISALQNQIGSGRYQVNVSALKRFMASGYNPNMATPQENDTFVTYDWAQPISTNFAIGANMAQGANQPMLDKVSKVTEAVKGGVDSLYEQPLLTGLSKVFSGSSAGQAAEEVGRGMMSSFVPTIVSQMNQYGDNARRDPYDPNFLKYSTNLAKSKIPILSKDLPQSFDVWGQPQERFKGGTNTFFNVFLNPAFVSTYKPNPEAQLILDLYTGTGETKQAPRLQSRKVKAYGFDIQPNAKTLQAMQQYAGQNTREMYRALMASKEFMDLPDDQKVQILSNKLSRIGADTKLKFLGNDLLQQAQKSGDMRKIYQVKQDLIEYLETEQAKTIYDQLQVMSADERAKYIETLNDEYPELLEKAGDLKTQKTYDQLMSMTPDERAKMIETMPDGLLERVTDIREKEIKKYNSKEFSGLNNRFAAQYIWQKANSFKNPEERKQYLQGLDDKGILSDELKEELIRIKEGKAPKYEKYLMPMGGYNIPY